MRKRRKLIWIFLGCAIAAVLLLTLWREHEPRYQGKSLSQWAAQIGRVDRAGRVEGENNEPEPEEAVRQIGTNALPFLLRWIQYEERPWQKHLALLCRKIPGTPGGIAADLVLGSGQQRQGDAFNALYALGPLARPAIPILATQLRGPLPGPIADVAVSVLAHIGDDALPPILTIVTNSAEPPPLRTLLIENVHYSWTQFTQTNILESVLAQCFDDQNFEVAVCAAGVLCNHRLGDERAMRVLTRGVETAMPRPKHIAVRYLRSYLGKIPFATVVQYLQDTNSPFSPYAAESLVGIAQKATTEVFTPESVLPALTNALHDPRPLVRSYSATALGSFDEHAEPAVPALLDVFSDPDFFARSAATNALFHIPAYRVLHDIAMLDELALPVSANQIHFRGYFNYPPGPPLARLLEHRDPRIREMATNAFRKLRENSSQNATPASANH